MSPTQMTEKVRSMIATFNEGNLDAFVQSFHPELEWIAVAGDREIRTGRQSIAEIFGPSIKDLGMHCEVQSLVAYETAVVTDELITDKDKKTFRRGYIYAFRDGMIDRMWTVR